MASFSNVQVIGNLTRDVEVRYTPSGTAVADVTIATNRKSKDHEETAFIDVTIWGRTAEIAGQYLSKGSQVHISGRLVTDTWQDKESGANRQKLKVVCENMTMLGGKGDGGGNNTQPKWKDTSSSQGAPAVDTDDVPF